MPIRTANIRSVRLKMACWCSVKSCSALSRTAPAIFGSVFISRMTNFLPGLTFVARSKERAAEDGRFPEPVFVRGEQRDDRRPAGVITGVPARARNPAAEEEPPATVVERDLAGGRGAETEGLEAPVVAHDFHAGNRRRARPQVRL